MFVAVAAVCLMVLPAHAGIIITEGKVASEGKSPDSKSSTGRRAAASGGEDKSSGCSEFDEDGFCVQGDDVVDEVDFDDVEDLELDEPEGWDCKEIGGGLQYCEPSGPTGSSPGAGAGGSLGADVGMDGEASQMGGCQGGSGGTSWPALSLLLGAAMLLRRRAVAQ